MNSKRMILTVLLLSAMLIITGCSNKEEEVPKETPLTPYSEQINTKSKEIMKDLGQEAHTTFTVDHAEEKDGEVIVTCFNADHAVSLELVFYKENSVLNDIRLWSYKNEENFQTYYDVYYPAFEKLDMEKLFDGQPYKKRKGSGSEDYKNGYTAYMLDDGRWDGSK